MRANKQSRHPVTVEIARAALVVGEGVITIDECNYVFGLADGPRSTYGRERVPPKLQELVLLQELVGKGPLEEPPSDSVPDNPRG